MLSLQIPDIPVAVPDSIPDVHQEVEMLKSLPFDELMQRLVSSAVTFAINLAIAIIVFYTGRFIINKIYRFVSGIFLRRRLDASLASFVLSMVRMVLYFILTVTVIGILGIETSSFIAIFASAGVAIGMALSGTLQNFAGGVLILLLKPYKIGDYIETQGYAGYVREIQIFHTVIRTGDNKSIIIPNGGLSTGSINNWSKEDFRRVDWNISISYGDSTDAARRAILEICASDDRIVKHYLDEHPRQKAAAPEESGREDAGEEKQNTGFFSRLLRRRKNAIKEATAPIESAAKIFEDSKVDRSPRVYVSELADSSVVLKVTAWVATDDYWGVFYTINERILNELPDAGINFPFPQLDVHLSQQQ